MGFLQTLRDCLSTAQDRLRFYEEALRFGLTIALLMVLLLLLLLTGP